MSVRNLRLKKPKSKINKEQAFIILLVLVWVRTILVSYAYQTMLRIPLISYFADVIKALVYAVAVAFAVPYIKKHIKIPDYLFYVVFVIIYVLSMLLNSRTAPYLQDNWVDILLISVPTFYVGLCFDKKYINVLHKWSIICMFFIIIYFLVIGYHGEINRGTDQNMGLAYRILPHLIIITMFAIKKTELLDVSFGIVGWLLLLACGTRGAALSFGLFIIVFFIMNGKRKNKAIIVFLLTLSVGAIYVFYDGLLYVIKTVLELAGFSTRVIDMLSSSDFLFDNGRNNIANFMITLIKEKPWIGYGIAGDRKVSELFGYRWGIAYSHNLFLELFVSFGCFIGTVASVWIIITLIKSYSVGDKDEKDILMALIFSGGFFKLLFSSSYLIEPIFFFLIGYGLRIVRFYKKKNRSSRLEYTNE